MYEAFCSRMRRASEVISDLSYSKWIRCRPSGTSVSEPKPREMSVEAMPESEDSEPNSAKEPSSVSGAVVLAGGGAVDRDAGGFFLPQPTRVKATRRARTIRLRERGSMVERPPE